MEIVIQNFPSLFRQHCKWTTENVVYKNIQHTDVKKLIFVMIKLPFLFVSLYEPAVEIIRPSGIVPGKSAVYILPFLKLNQTLHICMYLHFSLRKINEIIQKSQENDFPYFSSGRWKHLAQVFA
jgi:hypothetical protein